MTRMNTDKESGPASVPIRVIRGKKLLRPAVPDEASEEKVGMACAAA